MSETVRITFTETVTTTYVVSPKWLKDLGYPLNAEALEEADLEVDSLYTDLNDEVGPDEYSVTDRDVNYL